MDGETDGILQIGEIPVIRRRDRVIFNDHSQAFRSGAEAALQAALAYALYELSACGPYDDTRPWSEMVTFLQDRIRVNGATT